MLHGWKLTFQSALYLQEGEEFSPLGFENGPWHTVKSNHLTTKWMSDIHTTTGAHLPIPWDHLVKVRTKDWSYLILGVFTLVPPAILAAVAFCK